MEMPCKPNPSKSVPPDLSPGTRAIIERKTGVDYKDHKDLPSKLNLSYCKDLVDVSALGGVQHLDLSWCASVVDVSALGGVERLNLTGRFRSISLA